eukprot:2295750-Rhodomonas_salina.1
MTVARAGRASGSAPMRSLLGVLRKRTCEAARHTCHLQAQCFFVSRKEDAGLGWRMRMQMAPDTGGCAGSVASTSFRWTLSSAPLPAPRRSPSPATRRCCVSGNLAPRVNAQRLLGALQ